MSIEPMVDQGQELPSPTGQVIGYIPSQGECAALIKHLNDLGVPDTKIIVLAGDDGVKILERSQNEFFMGDAETETIQLGIVELRNGHRVVAVEADDREEAVSIANVATQHGGHNFSYFGTIISERLTK